MAIASGRVARGCLTWHVIEIIMVNLQNTRQILLIETGRLRFVLYNTIQHLFYYLLEVS